MLPPAAGAMVDVRDANACGRAGTLGKTPFELASGEGGANLADAVDQANAAAASAAPEG